MNEIAKVYETRDYDKFKILLGNRSIIPIQVARLEQSMNQKFLLSPILVSEMEDSDNLYIIDGQHRFEACRKLGLPIQYIIGEHKADEDKPAEPYGLKEVQLLNTHQKNWVKSDWLHAFCEQGYKEYITLKKFQMYYGVFSIGVCEMLLTNFSHHSKSGWVEAEKTGTKKGQSYSTKHFAKGEFKVVDYDKACESAEKIIEIKEYYQGYSRRSFIGAMLAVFKIDSYEHSRFIQRLASNPNALQHCSNMLQYKSLIEDIYNFRSHNKISLKYVNN